MRVDCPERSGRKEEKFAGGPGEASEGGKTGLNEDWMDLSRPPSMYCMYSVRSGATWTATAQYRSYSTAKHHLTNH